MSFNSVEHKKPYKMCFINYKIFAIKKTTITLREHFKVCTIDSVAVVILLIYIKNKEIRIFVFAEKYLKGVKVTYEIDTSSLHIFLVNIF